MYNQNDSSSDKEGNDEPERKQRMRGRLSRKSQENHSPNKSSRRLRNHDHNRTNQNLRSERELRNHHMLRNRIQLSTEKTRVTFQTFRALRKQQHRPVNDSKIIDTVENTEKSESRTPSDKETR